MNLPTKLNHQNKGAINYCIFPLHIFHSGPLNFFRITFCYYKGLYIFFFLNASFQLIVVYPVVLVGFFPLDLAKGTSTNNANYLPGCEMANCTLLKLTDCDVILLPNSWHNPIHKIGDQGLARTVPA